MLTVETEGPRAIVLGKEANYRVRLVNQGSAAADRVIVTVAVPTSVQVISSQARSGAVHEGGEDETSRQILWEMENVAARSQHELAFVVTADREPADRPGRRLGHSRPLPCKPVSKCSSLNWP